MTIHIPDRWIVVTLVDGEGVEVDKVLGGWHGGYLGSDSWQLNSGIVNVEGHPEYFLFHGYSGSVYKCYKARYGVTGLTSAVLSRFPKESVLSTNKYEVNE